MPTSAQRIGAMQNRRRAAGLRELRMAILGTCLNAFRRRIALQVAGLDLAGEADALTWIEAVSAFDEAAPTCPGPTPA